MKKLKYKSIRKSIRGWDTQLCKSEHSDCSVRSIATAFDVTYNQAHKFVKFHYRRKHGKGAHIAEINDKFSDDQIRIFDKTLNQIGEYSEEFSERRNDRSPIIKKGDKVTRMTVGRFFEENPKGTFIILVHGHVFTVKDRIVLGGNEEDSYKIKKRVQKAWEVL